MHMKFETEIPKQTGVTLPKPCHLQSPETEKSNMATRQPFRQERRLKRLITLGGLEIGIPAPAPNN